MSDFKTRLKELRKENRVPQKNIAEYLKVSVRAYQYYESGTIYPDFCGLIKLADYFSVSLDYLVGRSDDPEIHSKDKQQD